MFLLEFCGTCATATQQKRLRSSTLRFGPGHGARVILLEGHGVPSLVFARLLSLRASGFPWAAEEDVALWCQALEEAFGTARTRGSECLGSCSDKQRHEGKREGQGCDVASGFARLELQILGFDGQLCRVLADACLQRPPPTLTTLTMTLHSPVPRASHVPGACVESPRLEGASKSFLGRCMPTSSLNVCRG